MTKEKPRWPVARNDNERRKNNMSNQVKTASGETFALAFTPGMPPSLSGPNVYLLNDGSIAMGELTTEDGKQWLKSFNPAGMTPMDISAEKIIGWASAAPRRGVFG
jgi:hypothetical protein